MSGASPALDASARDRISAAIEAAEATTSGEIFCVVAHQSGDNHWTMLVWGAVLALLAPIGLLLVGLNPIELAGATSRLTGGGWLISTGQTQHQDAATGMLILVAIQIGLLLLTAVAGLFAPLRHALTPAFLHRQNVHRAALDQFLAHGIHVTEARTGVLIYVSLAEHHAEIIADTGIHRQVDKAVWSQAIASVLRGARAGDLSGGLVEAIGACGGVLAQHFPPRADDRDELPNRVIEI